MDAETLEAGRRLFGPGFTRAQLSPSRVKQAFRRQAMELHPDRYAGAPPEVVREKTRLFQLLSAAYRKISSALRAPAPDAAPRAPPPRPTARVPPVPLRLGTFLRHCGVASLADLGAALAWQARSRPRLGDVAVRLGLLSRERADEVARHLAPLERFGEAAARLGSLNPTQVTRLLWFQRGRQTRLGAWFVERGLLSEAELDGLVAELARHNAEVRRSDAWRARAGAAGARLDQPL